MASPRHFHALVSGLQYPPATGRPRYRIDNSGRLHNRRNISQHKPLHAIMLASQPHFLYIDAMTHVFPVLFAAVPALVAPAYAQQPDQTISASEFVEAQIAIIKGMTGLLTVKGIESSPQTVAGGVNQLAGMILQLAAVKPAATAEDAAIIETELADEARAAATELQRALETTVERNFYNSQELAEAIQNFVSAFQSLK
jgi:hypothetical protein